MASRADDIYLSENNSADVVMRRIRGGDGDRLSRVLASVIGHLHQAIVETRPTQAELRQAVEFLTEMGHACDEKRQEWVLLFDVLGASALVEDINTPRPKGATRNTVRGPFYRADAPRLASGASISIDGVGVPLTVHGKVLDLDGKPIPGAVIETWQANSSGFYENQQPDQQPEFNLRGIFEADKKGEFHYRTVKPSGYAVPSDGPAGALLGQVNYPFTRPAHLHFQITAPGFETVTTHVFDADDPQLNEDALFGVKNELIGHFEPPAVSGKTGWTLRYTFVMARSKKNGRPAI